VSISSDFFRTLASRFVGGDSERATQELIQHLLDIKNGSTFFPDKGSALQFYWSGHPRFSFFKTVEHDAKMLDVGAGSGGLQCWKGWMPPIRNDIRYYANDLTKGEFFENCERFFVHNLSESPLEGHTGYFDSVFACHVLEHVPEWIPFFDNTLDVLKPGGTLYLEWPTTKSIRFPRLVEFQNAGINTSTVNFHDDATHLHTADYADVMPYLVERGLEPVIMGTIENPFLGSELLAAGTLENDQELNTYGLWMALGFSQYIIAKKTD